MAPGLAPAPRQRQASPGDFTTEDARRGQIGLFHAIMGGASDPYPAEVARRLVKNAVDSKVVDLRTNHGQPVVLVSGRAPSPNGANGSHPEARCPPQPPQG